MATVYYERDCDISLVRDRKIAVIGYGSQGHAHALNLHDSGCDVRVGLRAGSSSAEKAREAGLKVLTPREAAGEADIVMMLTPDETTAHIYYSEIHESMTAGKVLAFAHGFNVHFQQIEAPAGVDVIMIAPKGPGHMVRRTFT
ncbi:MAG: NAD(P)-binding domain-containing protein, partial [Coriobacteriia bacterium]|nr:NAD(P)-binding domain-containing protein [Coriobacteriia bacterium]